MVWANSLAYPFYVYNARGELIAVIDEDGIRVLIAGESDADNGIIVSPGFTIDGEPFPFSPPTLMFIYSNPGVSFHSSVVTYNLDQYLTDAFGLTIYDGRSFRTFSENTPPVTLAAGWAQGVIPPRIRSGADCRGYLTGQITRAAGTPPDGTLLFTLPAPYLPLYYELQPVAMGSTNTIARLELNTNGQVRIYGAASNIVSLANSYMTVQGY